MSETQPTVAVEYRGKAAVVTVIVANILSEDELNRLKQAVNPLLSDSGLVLIMDFTDVRSISSSVIGYLVSLKKYIDGKGGVFRVCCIDKKVTSTSSDKYVYEIFKIVKLDTFFHICPTVEDALASF